MTNTEIAAAHREALASIGWKVGELTTIDGLPGFEVVQPYRVDGRGRKARVTPRQVQLRSFDVDGSMIVTVKE